MYIGKKLKNALCTIQNQHCGLILLLHLLGCTMEGAGVAVPMFSVRSDEDLGVGEFLDLKLLVDWAVNSGFHLVQLLPINDTSVHGM
jgi:4-alpha-glucanotransferase